MRRVASTRSGRSVGTVTQAGAATGAGTGGRGLGHAQRGEERLSVTVGVQDIGGNLLLALAYNGCVCFRGAELFFRNKGLGDVGGGDCIPASVSRSLGSQPKTSAANVEVALSVGT